MVEQPGADTMTCTRWPLAATCLGLGLLGGLTAGQRLIGQPADPLPAPGGAPALPRDWMSYAPVTKKALPAVVCIEGKGKVAKPKLDDPDPGFGSGVLIDPTGVVLTNNHVVAQSSEVEVTLQDGRKFTTKDIRRDPKTDIAVLLLGSKEPLPFLEFGDSDAMEVGDRVLALGAPFGLTGSVTQGIVSAKSRQNLNLNLYEDFLQIDAAVNPGNSGGPLVNMEGKVIGLTAAIKTRTGGFQGVGLAVSSKLARSIADQLVKNGSVRRPYLGVLVRELDATTAAQQKLKPDGGVLVTKVFEKSPGERANIGVGDVIVSVNGQPVGSPRAMQKATLALPVGKELDVLVIRKGKLFLTKATAEDQPDVIGPEPEAPAPIRYDDLGLTVTDLTADVAARMGLPKTVKGVVVSVVARNSLAEQSGLTRGLVVLQVERTPVATATEFRAAVERASREKGAVLHVLRANGDIDFVILRGQ
jgi:serine protease Do